jgi:hypothetical protein
MPIEYRVNAPLSADQFIDLLQRSTHAKRRPVGNRTCMEGTTTSNVASSRRRPGSRSHPSLTAFQRYENAPTFQVAHDLTRRGFVHWIPAYAGMTKEGAALRNQRRNQRHPFITPLRSGWSIICRA